MNPAQLPPQVRPPLIEIEDSPAWLLYGDSWAPALVAAVDAARHSIDLAAYAIQPGWDRKISTASNVYRALINATRRGVRCRALLAEHGRTRSTRWFNVKARKDLEINGWQIRLIKAPRMLHAKCIIIDNRVMAFGSHNFSLTAARENIDLSVMIEGGNACAPAVEWFNRYWDTGQTWRPDPCPE